LSLSRTLYLEKLLSTSHDVTDEYLKRVKSLAESPCSFLPNSVSFPHKMSETLHRVEYPGFRSSTLCNFALSLLATSPCTHDNSLSVCFTMFVASHNFIPTVSSMETHILFFSDTISYFVDCILVARSKIVLSELGFSGNGMSCVFFQELSKTGDFCFM